LLRLMDPGAWDRVVALALAPHPDDPDAIAVTLRLLADQGWEMHWAVVTSGWSGVRDDFCGPDRRMKAETRMAEQRESARLFGLPEDRLRFLETRDTDEGELARTDDNQRLVTSLLDTLQPDVVLLPHRKDSNPTHRLVYEWFAEWADSITRPLLALGNEDPKSVDFHPNVEVVFGEEEALWKASLLECHRSQSARNQATRGITFAERILGMNRRADGTYSERFEALMFKHQAGEQ
jgi:LmbE family N-acetylglucosaminyl deacetylase